jgi:hypothetical protein
MLVLIVHNVAPTAGAAMKCAHICVCIALVLTSVDSRPAQAQASDSVWIAGTVVDSVGAPVRDAAVIIQPDAIAVRTDSLGAFRVRVPAGPAIIIARRLGYEPFQAELQLDRGRDRRFQIVMITLPATLDAVETMGRKSYMPVGAPASLDDFYRRRAEGKGRTFTRDEIERTGSIRAVLATVPGIRVESDVHGNVTSITVPRCSPSVATTQTVTGMDRSESSSAGGNKVLWFVDGHQVQTAPDVRDQDVEAVEVYRGSSALPAEAIGNACAAVFIWTRREP